MENTYPIYIQLRQTLSGAHPTWHKASPQFYWPGCHWDNLGAVYRLVTEGAMGQILSCFFYLKILQLENTDDFYSYLSTRFMKVQVKSALSQQSHH